MTDSPTRTLPSRNEIEEAYRWRLEDIYPDEQAWHDEFRRAESLLEQASRHRGGLAASPEAVLACLRWTESIRQAVSRVYTYALLKQDEDTTVGGAQALYERAQNLIAQAGEATAFIEPELLALPEEELRALPEAGEELAVYRHWFEELLRRRPHVLTAELESLLAQFREVAQAPTNVFTMLNNADLKFPEVEDDQGRTVELTKGNIIQFLQSRDRQVRSRAYTAFSGTYRGVRNTIAAALTGAVKRHVLFARVRKYGSALEAALHGEQVPPEVYHNLITTVNDHLGPLHRYISLRRRLLDLDKVHAYDMFVPIVPDVKIEVAYRQAVDHVTEALRPLGEEYGAALRQAFADRWVDVYENRGKRSGAYSMGWAHQAHPYVLMNYQNDVRSMFTLAHEMGHAMHSHFSSRHQPYVYQGYTIFVAEVASTVNEALLVHHLLNTLEDEQERAYILNHYLDDFRGTVYLQVQFAEFERAIHEAVERGEALTADRMTELYRELVTRYQGPDYAVDEGAGLDWARVPHFHMNFYVYKYATGFAAATALARGILEEGAPAVERYLDFLKSGSSDFPLELLRGAGVDLTTPEPIAAALGRFDQAVAELEATLT